VLAFHPNFATRVADRRRLEVSDGSSAAAFGAILGHGTWKCSPLRSLISAPVATLPVEATLWATELSPGYAGLVMTLTNSTQPHPETHFTGSEFVRDIVIGMSDGLTVPFALAAGLSGAVESGGIIQTVVVGGLAASAAFLIAKALG
jgi:hypothetical protein